MTHLTITGYNAGTPLCDVDKPQAIERGEKFYHAMYFNFDAPYASDLFVRCKAEYDAAMAEDDESV